MFRARKSELSPGGSYGDVLEGQGGPAYELEATAQRLHQFQRPLVDSICERNEVLEQERDAIAAKLRGITTELESTQQFLDKLKRNNEGLRAAAPTIPGKVHGTRTIMNKDRQWTWDKSRDEYSPAQEGLVGEKPKTTGLRESMRQKYTMRRKGLGLVGTEQLQVLIENEEPPSEQNPVFGGVTRPRRIIANNLISDALQPNSDITRKARSIEGLTNLELDFSLAPMEGESFSNIANTGDFKLPSCQICRIPNLATKEGSVKVDMFPRPPLADPCCGAIICKECYLKEVTRSLTDHWWSRDIHAASWILCPSPHCFSLLPIFGVQDLKSVLEQLGDSEISRHLALYDRLLNSRRIVGELCRDRTPTTKELNITSTLHNQLIGLGLIVNPLAAATETQHPTTIDVRMIDIDYPEYSARIPLFTSFFRRTGTPRECSFCAEEYSEINFGAVDNWVDSCHGFIGDWMWKVLQFPSKLGLTCNHEIDFCTTCLGRHIQARLEEYGRSRCDQIACPSVGCNRLLTYDEIRLYTSESTFTIYDRYLNLNALSQFPNFKWCLRPSCGNGQLYDLQDGNVPWGGPLVRCEECDFEMCYTHSIPWHTGQTCEQYNSDQGDPSSQLSREWITGNTKKCPKCKVNIEKGNNCFHMTCTCRFEFCWICLAEWKFEYDKNAHRVGCFFRTSDLQPTELSGTNIQDALEHRWQHG